MNCGVSGNRRQIEKEHGASVTESLDLDARSPDGLPFRFVAAQLGRERQDPEASRHVVIIGEGG